MKKNIPDQKEDFKEQKIKHTRIPHSRFIYQFISWTLGSPLRHLTMNANKVLTKIGLTKGQTVLEVGCGPGFFTIPAAKKIEPGILFALDIYPMMIQKVQDKAQKHKLKNVKTINVPASETGLSSDSIDLIYCIDVLSDISDIDDTLKELHRILEPNGILAVYEPHTGIEPGAWRPERSIKELTQAGLFKLKKQDSVILLFSKITNKTKNIKNKTKKG